MTQREKSFDFVVVGSGGGGLVAALAAHEAGLSTVILERQSVVGGSTAMSGGVIWMPNNPLMRAEGVDDSREAGLTYLDAVVGQVDDASTAERRRAFVDLGPEMISFIQSCGVELVRCEGYSDYYDLLPGGHSRGRAVEGVPWDLRRLGDWQSRINPGIVRSLNLVLKTNESRLLMPAFRSPRTLARVLRVLGRTYLSRARRQDLVTNGMSLVGQLTKSVLDREIPILLDTDVTELVTADGRVRGVRASRGSETVDYVGVRGVLLAAGGFERNPEMRLRYSAGSQPNDGSRTFGNPGNTGTMLQAAIELGAGVAYMDEAVWNPAPRLEIAMSSLITARQYPHTILVNRDGARFVNESNSYLEVVKAMYAHEAVPAWLVFDDAFRRKYPWGRGLPKLRQLRSALPGRMPPEWVERGWIKTAATIDGLAAQIDVDPARLSETVRSWNAAARHGRDPQFRRGESRYNKVLGDPTHRPNPAVGPLLEPPFYAAELHAADVGTLGGVLTDDHARVLSADQMPIPGLYAAGNMAATVTGRTYPGAGASIAHTMTFGFAAARHAAESDRARV